MSVKDFLEDVNHWFLNKSANESYFSTQAFESYNCKSCGNLKVHSIGDIPMLCPECTEVLELYLMTKGWKAFRE